VHDSIKNHGDKHAKGTQAGTEHCSENEDKTEHITITVFTVFLVKKNAAFVSLRDLF